MEPEAEGGDEVFLRIFPQMKLRVEDSGIIEDLEVQEILDSDNNQEGGEQYLVISEDNSDEDCPLHCGSQERTDPDEFFSRLPDELWIEILRDFGPFELCNIGFTCKALLRLTRYRFCQALHQTPN